MSKIQLSNFAPPSPTATSHSINGVDFEITSFIPYEDLLTSIQWAILLITDSKGYISEPVKIACRELILVAAYTNLDLSRLELAEISQRELYEMYDIVKNCGIISAVKATIDPDQLDFFLTTLDATLNSIMTYRNSAAGILELLSAESATMKENLSTILNDFNDTEKTATVVKMADFMQSQQK